MAVEEFEPVTVSRRIGAPAGEIFQVLADPRRHLGLDGSGMLRGAVTDGIVTGVGDVFVMKMYYSEQGDYEMDDHVVDYELNRRIGWEPVAGRGHPDEFSGEARWGHRWSFDLDRGHGGDPGASRRAVHRPEARPRRLRRPRVARLMPGDGRHLMCRRAATDLVPTSAPISPRSPPARRRRSRALRARG